MRADRSVQGESIRGLGLPHRWSGISTTTTASDTETPYVRRVKEALAPVRQQVRWCGFVSRDRMPELYAAGDLLVQPSVGPEAFSNTILEAMACGLPVVTFAHGGACEAVRHEETGLLVDLADSSGGLHQAVDRLLADPATRCRMGRAGRRLVEQRFSWEAVAQETVALYEELMGKNGHAAAKR